MQELSDLELITQLQQGNKNALNILMGRYKHKLYTFVKRYGIDDDTAYDIVQETFIKVHFKADTYNANYKFSTWLYQIAMNLCRDWGRKNKLRQWLSLDARISDDYEENYHDIISGRDSNIEDVTDLKKNLKLLDIEIQKLPHNLKAALILFAIEENSQEECAEILGITPKTVETRVYRARKILAEKIAKNF